MHASVAKHYFNGGSFPIGGSSKIANTIDNVIESSKGTILVSAEVKNIIIKNNKAFGVEMSDGKKFYSDLIISGTGVFQTYNHLITGLNKVHLRINNGPFTDMLASNVRKDHVQKLYAYLRDNVSSHRARHTIKFLKLVWNVCEDNDKLKGNPWKVIKLDSDTICDILWTERQVDRFIETADKMGFPSVGTLAMLCYDLCQRPGDMRQLKWENFDGETFVFTQEKTKTEIKTIQTLYRF